MKTIRSITALLFISAFCAWAQDDSIYVAGTSCLVNGTQTYSWLAFQSDAPDLLRERKLAVYRKLGDAASGSDFVRVSVIGPQTDERTITVLLKRAEPLDSRLHELDQRIHGVFSEALPADDLSTAEILAYIISIARDEPEVYENLYLLARLHPGVALCLGTAFSETLASGTYTYEIREYPALNVLGRVTIDTTAPVILAAPDSPREVVPVAKAPDHIPIDARQPSAKGHLTVGLRWGVPVELRRLALLHFGYNVYRVPEAKAIAEGWDKDTPLAGILAETAKTGTEVRRVNETPVLIDRMMTDAEAADTTDRETVFIVDAEREGDQKFENGDRFYYYVCGIDPLGRDGDYSVGSLVVISDRLAPAAPRQVRVENNFEFDGAEKRALKVRWRTPRPKDDEEITRFYIYRWSKIPQMQQNSANPAVNRIGVVDADGSDFYEFLDDGSMTSFTDEDGNELIDDDVAPDVPGPETDLNKTFWYTVRAVDDAAGGGNVSGNSAPAYGVLRDRSFDGRAQATFRVNDEKAEFVGVEVDHADFPGDHANYYYLKVHVQVLMYAQCTVKICAQSGAHGEVLSEQRLFGSSAGTPEELVVEARLLKADFNPADPNVVIVCQITGARASAEVSKDISTEVQIWGGKQERVVVTFQAIYTLTRQDLNPVDPSHFSLAANGTTVVPLRMTVELPPDTFEYKIYRRLDDGPFVMLQQGLAEEELDGSLADVEAEDEQLLLHDGRVSYYTQVFDRHGNPGPMVLFKTIEMRGKTPVDPPRLLPIVPSGTPSNPKIRLRWFKPVYEVEKFLIYIYTPHRSPPEDLSPYLKCINSQDPYIPATYVTGSVGVGFAPQYASDTLIVKDNTYFDLELPVTEGDEYQFYVGCLTRFGRYSHMDRSAMLSYTWEQTGGEATGGVSGGSTPGVGPGGTDLAHLAWPAREVPEAVTPENTFPDLSLRFEDDYVVSGPRYQGVFLRVGKGTSLDKPSDPTFLRGDVDPKDSIYSNPEQYGSLFPFVLYRRQVASNTFTTINPAVYQVSPLIEKIAHEVVQQEGSGDMFTLLKDDFFAMLQDADGYGIYLRDTAPVIRAATYQYYIVRFDKDNGEPLQTIVLPSITIPDNEVD